MNHCLFKDLVGSRFTPSDARAALVIVHGLGEHRGRYIEVAKFLEGAGIACFTYDQRGHGESPGRRTHIGDFAELSDDLSQVVTTVRNVYAAWPIFLWGHSLGSIVLLSCVLDHSEGIRGAITTGCPLDSIPPMASAVSGVGAKLFDLLPEIRVSSRLDPELLSHDKAVQRAYLDDALVTTTVTLEFVFELSEAIKRVKANARSIRIPWLAVHGGDDNIAPPDGSRQLIAALGSEDKRLVVMEHTRHEPHNEEGERRERFLALLVDWITERAEQ